MTLLYWRHAEAPRSLQRGEKACVERLVPRPSAL